MVKISELKLPKIRKVIPFYGENGDEQIINVYNPTPETRAKFREIMDKNTDEESGELTIDPMDMMIKVFPLFSDIEIDVDYIDDIIMNPTKEMILVNSEIISIMNEINLENIMNQNMEYERLLILMEQFKGINMVSYIRNEAQKYDIKNDFDPLNAESMRKRNENELTQIKESYKKVQGIYEEVVAKSEQTEADISG